MYAPRQGGPARRGRSARLRRIPDPQRLRRRLRPRPGRALPASREGDGPGRLRSGGDGVRLARVLGDLVAEIRHPHLDGFKLLWVAEVDPSGRATGRRELALDRVDAGAGDHVLVLDEGNSAAQILGRPRGAIRTLIVGVVDDVERTAPSGGRS
ncbi:MAG: hypothetical protein GF355_08010 [Candidatus Eisenbacteria bacterium]|nr:hypothetical protein [Candidatus Eisenbacteria bacterium]